MAVTARYTNTLRGPNNRAVHVLQAGQGATHAGVRKNGSLEQQSWFASASGKANFPNSEIPAQVCCRKLILDFEIGWAPICFLGEHTLNHYARSLSLSSSSALVA
jgi:hypothetical protein